MQWYIPASDFVAGQNEKLRQKLVPNERGGKGKDKGDMSGCHHGVEKTKITNGKLLD